MMHKARKFGVSVETDPAILAEKISEEHTWTGCTAFRLGRYIFANDSTGGDGAQEYAVLLDDGSENLRQVESITFGWCPPAKALEYVQDVIAGKYDAEHYASVPRNRFEDKHATCYACA